MFKILINGNAMYKIKLCVNKYVQIDCTKDQGHNVSLYFAALLQVDMW